MNSNLQVVNIDSLHQYAYESQRLGAAGGTLVLRQSKSEDEVLEACAEADVVLVERSPVTPRVIEGMRRCRGIVMYGVGYDPINVPAATGRGIVVANAADYCSDEVADHAAALLLSLARRVTAMDRNIRAGGWYDFPSYGPLRRLNKLTLGLVGVGRIGRGMAKRMAGFGVRILAFDPYASAGSAGPEVEMTSLERVLGESDLVSIHTPLTAETRGSIGEAQLRMMKPTALLVNTSRGAVVDEPALVRALEEKWIAGAALDVFQKEPLPASSPLRKMEQVIFTPHYGASSEDAEAHLRKTVADSAEALLLGHWPPFPVNRQVAPRFPLKPWAELDVADRPAPTDWR